jgi:hypothetical protein
MGGHFRGSFESNKGALLGRAPSSIAKSVLTPFGFLSLVAKSSLSENKDDESYHGTKTYPVKNDGAKN